MDNQISSVRRGVVTKAKVYFPDEIVMEIISWLPAKTVLICRCVCKRWRELTLTPDFLDLFSSRSSPLILFQNYWAGYPENHLYVIDNWWKPERSMPPEFPIPTPDIKPFSYMLFSHDGLIVYKDINGRSFLVQNPIYRDECVQISLAPEISESCMIYGVFFHPCLKEYCTLWRISIEGKPAHYKMLNLGPKLPCWREISNPWNDKSLIGRRPVLVDGYLYWMVEPRSHYEIMEFDIKNEKFSLIPYPVPRAVAWHHVYMLNIDNLLSLVEISTNKEIVHINVWTLQDREKESWTNFTYTISLEASPMYGMARAVAVWKGELFLKVDTDMFVCNLKLGTSKKLTRKTMSTLYSSFYSHSMSLASLKIHMD